MTLRQKLVLRQKLIVIGEPGIGKSALVQMFESDGAKFPRNYAMTVNLDLCVKSVVIPDSPVIVELFIHDTAGQDVFKEYIKKACQGASGFCLVFDLTDAESLARLEKWQKDVVHEVGYRNIPGVLIGTKSDLTGRRAVTVEEAEQMASKFGCEYFECSALNNHEVDLPFYFLANAFYHTYNDRVSRFVAATEMSKS